MSLPKPVQVIGYCDLCLDDGRVFIPLNNEILCPECFKLVWPIEAVSHRQEKARAYVLSQQAQPEQETEF